MFDERERDLLWWLIPGVLAGMPMPYVHPDRRMAGGGVVEAFPDELPTLYFAGVRAVVSLLNLPADKGVYESAGFDFLCLPVPDGNAPSMAQVSEFVKFVEEHRANQRAVAVHCAAGIGRTGTMLAAYLISRGDDAAGAIRKARAVESRAVETNRQIQFLEDFSALLGRQPAPG